ncbi:DUF2752 domain-containing protein [Gordonia sp. (in: high G+C Gram-positive bacteria)]|uniref:DUF2752 domain-containing protein n=1 Tax=Gordonia sp. (in: high G+C Gram-positive bacteria) TaxID=84139 RepID=UPI00260F9D83|nr:DUF2752 domain-containing protein [Gordonia sp. (in: high G+C Gram-positive bacteria)]HMS77523.1 DUF2752 domain-containing protein [Gordonia sp. (in: high G+C Gram-positive bacteria)]
MSAPNASTPPTLARSLSRVSGAEWVAAAGIVGIGVASVASPAHIEDGPILCPFRLMTGLSCPGCGLTRSWVYTMHGDWAAALGANIFGPLLIVAVVVLTAVVVARRIRSRPAPALEAIARHRLTYAVLAVWLVYAVVRLITEL